MDWLKTLQAAGLPATKAYEEIHDDGTSEIQAEFSTGLTAEQNNLFLSLTNPAKAEYSKSSKDLKDEYETAPVKLQQITATQNPSNAQVIAAVKYQAKVLLLLIKIIMQHFKN